MTDILTRLENWDTVCEEDADCDGSLYAAAHSEITKLRKILSHILADRTGAYFICGQGGEIDRNGMPDLIHVCPAFGLDWAEIYERRGVKGPEW